MIHGLCLTDPFLLVTGSMSGMSGRRGRRPSSASRRGSSAVAAVTAATALGGYGGAYAMMSPGSDCSSLDSLGGHVVQQQQGPPQSAALDSSVAASTSGGGVVISGHMSSTGAPMPEMIQAPAAYHTSYHPHHHPGSAAPTIAMAYAADAQYTMAIPGQPQPVTVATDPASQAYASPSADMAQYFLQQVPPQHTAVATGDPMLGGGGPQGVTMMQATPSGVAYTTLPAASSQGGAGPTVLLPAQDLSPHAPTATSAVPTLTAPVSTKEEQAALAKEAVEECGPPQLVAITSQPPPLVSQQHIGLAPGEALGPEEPILEQPEEVTAAATVEGMEAAGEEAMVTYTVAPVEGAATVGDSEDSTLQQPPTSPPPPVLHNTALSPPQAAASPAPTTQEDPIPVPPASPPCHAQSATVPAEGVSVEAVPGGAECEVDDLGAPSSRMALPPLPAPPAQLLQADH